MSWAYVGVESAQGTSTVDVDIPAGAGLGDVLVLIGHQRYPYIAGWFGNCLNDADARGLISLGTNVGWPAAVPASPDAYQSNTITPMVHDGLATAVTFYSPEAADVLDVTGIILAFSPSAPARHVEFDTAYSSGFAATSPPLAPAGSDQALWLAGITSKAGRTLPLTDLSGPGSYLISPGSPTTASEYISQQTPSPYPATTPWSWTDPDTTYYPYGAWTLLIMPGAGGASHFAIGYDMAPR